jgi:hypothetical protein
VLQVRLVSGANISFMTNGSWGAVNEPQCTLPASGTLMYKFVARGYRIDPNLAGDPVRAAVGALQQSAVGGLLSTDALNGWSDIAYGFTDIQTALQVYDHATDPSDTPDPDTDGDREWYSGAAQNVHTGTDGSVPVTFPLQISISLVARTDRDIEGVTTTATPPLLDPTTPTNLDNNTVGNRPSIALPSATDLTLQGSRIYRYITFQVDFRNIGVGK